LSFIKIRIIIRKQKLFIRKNRIMNKIWVGLIIGAVILLIIRFVACKYFTKCTLFNDMLKELAQDNVWRYSQGRVYLFASLAAYFVTLGFMTGQALKPSAGIVDNSSATQIIDSLQWVIALFAGYVFGGKGLEVLKFIMTNKKGGDQSQAQPPQGQ